MNAMPKTDYVSPSGAVAARVAAERAAQGLPPRVVDETTLRRVAALLKAGQC